MNDNSNRPLSILEKIACAITQTDKHLLSLCPDRTRRSVVNSALLQSASWIAQTGTITLVTHLLLDKWEVQPLYILPAALVATIIQLSDTTALIKSSESIDGLDQLRRGGLEVQLGPGTRIKHGVQLVIRMGLGLVYAQLTAIGLTFLIFNGDITRFLSREAADANAPIIATAGRLYDAKTVEESGRLDVLKAAQAKAIEDASTLRRDALAGTAPDPAYTAALDLVRRLEAEREKLLERLAEAERFSSAELDGRRVGPGSSGAAGDGPVRRAAEERRAKAQAAVDRNTADLAAARARLAELEKMRSGDREGRKTLIGTRLEETLRAEALYQEKIDALDAALRAQAVEREAAITSAVEHDPAYVPPAKGLLARARALQKLMEDVWVRTLVILFDIAFFGIELGAVLGKVLSSVPSRYAVRLAGDDYADDVEVAHETFGRISRLGPMVPANDTLGSSGRVEIEPVINPAPPASGQEEDDANDLDERLRSGASAAQAAEKKRTEAVTQRSGTAGTGTGRRGPGRPPGSRNRPKPDTTGEPPLAA